MAHIFVASLIILLVINRVARLVPFMLTRRVPFYTIALLNITAILFILVRGVPGVPDYRNIEVLVSLLVIFLILFHLIPLFTRRNEALREKRGGEIERKKGMVKEIRIVDGDLDKRV